jgi:flagellar biogenesis protein FliO
MDFIGWIIEMAAVCFQQEKDWNVRRIVWILVVLIAIIVVGYWLFR